MTCCGRGRSQLSNGGAIAGALKRRLPASRVVLYEYTGSSAMTVAGPSSGALYRFGAPGATLQVDLRDAASMATLPNLRRLR